MIALAILIGVVLLFGFVVAFGAPYVPSLSGEVKRAFTSLYPVSKSDVVVDLGSGDGRVLRQAMNLGARAYGYELNPLLVIISKLVLGQNATVRVANMYSVTLPASTTLVYAFSVSRDSKRLGDYVQQQANVLGRPLSVMTFGSQLKGHEPTKTERAHTLYTIRPMQ